ncbi:hypothetical protein C8A01DRAFT_46942 [Parachaetomium inaequale]|uniref:Uncharacterized protein n=1 Tax=Parachaetomium inaequale TaxID=2588326 RepID=A0AAN6PFB7_9PEZI|nr:hypothetical protein C8A01DRAFT_46942 [Parachaetomium inaequale]
MAHLSLQGPAGSVSPAAFLFRSAWPAVPGIDVPASLWSRQTDGSTCGAGETTCGAGETCSLDNGAFFCCPAGAGTAGCSRVCAAGDFQCGSICCADGQTCMGADTLSPFCVSQSRTRVSSAIVSTATTFSTGTATSSLPSSTSSSFPASSSTTSTSPTQTPSTASATAIPTATTSPTADQPPPAETTDASTGTATPQQGGLPHSAQIAIGIIVPVAVVFLVAALWFLIFRRPGQSRGHRRWGTGRSSFGAGTGSRGPTPPPAFSKNGLGAAAAGAPLSMHEQYMMEAEAERGRDAAGYELADLRGAAGQPWQGPAGDVSPMSGGSSPSGRASPHPGNPVVV